MGGNGRSLRAYLLAATCLTAVSGCCGPVLISHRFSDESRGCGGMVSEREVRHAQRGPGPVLPRLRALGAHPEPEVVAPHPKFHPVPVKPVFAPY